jgi:putative intracellular protease/amidase
VLRAPGADRSRGLELRDQLAACDVSTAVLVPERPGEVGADSAFDDDPIPRSIAQEDSASFDAVVLLGDTEPWLAEDQQARRFVEEAYRQSKPIGALDQREDVALATLAAVVDKPVDGLRDDEGVITQPDPAGSTSAFTQLLLAALERQHIRTE